MSAHLDGVSRRTNRDTVTSLAACAKLVRRLLKAGHRDARGLRERQDFIAGSCHGLRHTRRILRRCKTAKQQML